MRFAPYEATASHVEIRFDPEEFEDEGDKNDG